MNEWVKYSKPSGDISGERRALTAVAVDSLRRQSVSARNLAARPRRTICLLCEASVSGAPVLLHRGAHLLVCSYCGHLQSVNVPNNFGNLTDSDAFSRVYPPLSFPDLVSRVERIYIPKLDWILEAAERNGITSQEMKTRSWLELGCGAGYFLHALEKRGVIEAEGVDFSAGLVSQANRYNSLVRARQSINMLGDLEKSEPEVVVAFFVLEHLENPQEFWQIMASKPPGTILVFSVPTLGVTTLLENAFEGIPARNLDWEVHHQLYTDKSISFSLANSGYHKISEWLFGQDAQDLVSHLQQRLAENGDWGGKLENLVTLEALIDPLQSVIDRSRLCDARHVLAIKQ